MRQSFTSIQMVQEQSSDGNYFSLYAPFHLMHAAATKETAETNLKRCQTGFLFLEQDEVKNISFVSKKLIPE
jgi:hypothetical protein